ncbi:C-C chemokine receptor type 4-like [Protopterus annectens]|uniref:C-C chemokine receptor type 4-like n=1 Tax=Protopterus annectens TaxID=7888 RepID=UPI001CF9FD6D|nr:C-C chemokine receptor type 4-like [Protopterus annectens]
MTTPWVSHDDENYTYDYTYYPGNEPCKKDNVKEFGSTFIPALYSIVFITGLIGNLLVIRILWPLICKATHTMTDIYLFNLAFSDLLFVITLPFWAYTAAYQWIFGEVLCKLISWTYVIGFYSSIFFITAMSVERYLAIVHAIKAKKIQRLQSGITLSCIIWAAAFIISVPEAHFNKVEIENIHKTCRPSMDSETLKQWKLAHNFEINILGLLIPLIIMIFCYSRIIKTLLRKMTFCPQVWKRRRAIRLIFIVMIVFLIFWIPYNISLLLRSLEILEVYVSCSFSKGIDISLQLTETIAFVHCCLNPFIYVFVGIKFKNYLYELIKNCLPSFMICDICHSSRRDSVTSSQTMSSYDHSAFIAL